MKVLGLGVDATEISRFRSVLSNKRDRFVANTFSKTEQEYCRSYRDPAPHFAGIFAAKEAARKASGDFSLPFKALEIRRDNKGKPEVWIKNKRARSLLVSITHSRDIACAAAIDQRL